MAVSLSSLGSFFYRQFFVTPPHPAEDFTGKTIIVTGANVGLGFEAVKHFTRLNASKVVIAVRSLDKGEAAKKEIEFSTKRTGIVEVWQLDLLSYESVKQFAERASSLERIDALIENAGLATQTHRLAASGNEVTIDTNVVSTFLLALLLLPKLKQTAQRFNTQPHLVIVSSEVHFWTAFPERLTPLNQKIFDTLNNKETARMDDRYNVSKLLEVLICREICKEHPQPYPVVINFLNPGFCHSSLTREMTGVTGILVTLFKYAVARTTEQGSRTLVHAAAAGPETHGRYLSDARIAEPSPLVASKEGEEAQRRVWDELRAKLEEIQPGISNNL